MKYTNKKRRSVLVLLGLALVMMGGQVLAGGFDVDWWSIDSGGDTEPLTGGGFSLKGSIGQPDAGAAMSGGAFDLTGGFWAGAVAIYQPGDCNGNGYVELDDFSTFWSCLEGPASSLNAGCDCADINLDGSVDLMDMAEFQVLFNQ